MCCYCCIDCVVLAVGGVGDDRHCALCGLEAMDGSPAMQISHAPAIPPTSVTRYRVCTCVVGVVLTVFCLFQVVAMIDIVACWCVEVAVDSSPAIIQSHAAPAIPPSVRRYRVCINVM